MLIQNVERDPHKLELLTAWKVVLQKRHTISFFANANKLALQVAADLSRTIANLRKQNLAEVHDEQAVSRAIS